MVQTNAQLAHELSIAVFLRWRCWFTCSCALNGWLFSGREKIRDHVDFPLTDFDMTAFCEPRPTTEPGPPPRTSARRSTAPTVGGPPKPEPIPWWTQSARYRLVAIVSHLGRTMDQGHYTATCFNQSRQSWVHFNDQKVRQLSVGLTGV